MKYIAIILLIALIGCNPCRQVAKHPECFRPDTVKQVERIVHVEQEFIIKDSIHYDTLPGELIEKTVFQTKWKIKTDTIYRLEKKDRMNPINEKLKQDYEKVQKKSEMLRIWRNRFGLSLLALILLIAVYLYIKNIRRSHYEKYFPSS